MKWRIEIVNLTVSSTTNPSRGLTLENRIKGFSWCLRFSCRLLFTRRCYPLASRWCTEAKCSDYIIYMNWKKGNFLPPPPRDPVVTVSVEREGRKQVWPFFLKVVLVTHYIQEGLFPLCMSEEKRQNLTGVSGKYPRDRATYVCPPLTEEWDRCLNYELSAHSMCV